MSRHGCHRKATGPMVYLFPSMMTPDFFKSLNKIFIKAKAAIPSYVISGVTEQKPVHYIAIQNCFECFNLFGKR